MPALAPGEIPKERKDDKLDGKKKTQADIEQEMAALQYTNPMLLEVRHHVCSTGNSVASSSQKQTNNNMIVSK